MVSPLPLSIGFSVEVAEKTEHCSKTPFKPGKQTGDLSWKQCQYELVSQLVPKTAERLVKGKNCTDLEKLVNYGEDGLPSEGGRLVTKSKGV